MLDLLALKKPSVFGDEIVLRSIDWLENFPWSKENSILDQKDKYEVCLNVKNFTSKEIQIKTFDGMLLIEGKHDEKKDEIGYISRHFVRKYTLPEDCIVEEVQSRLTPEGMLIVTAPRKEMLKLDTIIPVSHDKRRISSSKL